MKETITCPYYNKMFYVGDECPICCTEEEAKNQSPNMPEDYQADINGRKLKLNPIIYHDSN